MLARTCARLAEHGGVAPGAAVQHVVAEASVEHVVAAPPLEHVRRGRRRPAGRRDPIRSGSRCPPAGRVPARSPRGRGGWRVTPGPPANEAVSVPTPPRRSSSPRRPTSRSSPAPPSSTLAEASPTSTSSPSPPVSLSKPLSLPADSSSTTACVRTEASIASRPSPPERVSTAGSVPVAQMNGVGAGRERGGERHEAARGAVTADQRQIVVTGAERQREPGAAGHGLGVDDGGGAAQVEHMAAGQQLDRAVGGAVVRARADRQRQEEERGERRSRPVHRELYRRLPAAA